jgi:hypothetical protein
VGAGDRAILETMSTGRTRRYGAHAFATSNAGKLLFPGAGITKADLIDYHERVAEVMFTHVRGRIVTMERYPDGIDGKRFVQKDVPACFPGWIETVTVHAASIRRARERLDDLAQEADVGRPTRRERSRRPSVRHRRWSGMASSRV